jgi:membrane associated rhomboid family serine protease
MTGPPASVHPTPRVTAVLATVNLGVFLAMVLSGVSAFQPTPVDLIHWGALFGPLTINDEWWRLGSSMFLHVGMVHLALNGLCVLSLGPLAEEYFGPGSYLVGFVLGGLGGSLTSLAIHQSRVGAGASGAIFGVASRLYVATLIGKQRQWPSATRSPPHRLGKFLLVNLAYGLFQPEIDNAAHVGGLLTGAALGLLAPMAAADGGQRRRHLAVVSAVGAAIVALAAASLGRFRPVSFAERTEVLHEIADATRKERRGREATTDAAAADGRLRRQVADLREAIRAHPDSAQAYLLLGNAYGLLGQPDEAMRTFREGLARRPADLDLLTALGTVSLNSGRLNEAVAAYEQALAVNPRRADANYNLAFAYSSRGVQAADAGQRDSAAADFRRILALRTDSSVQNDARRRLASLHHDAPPATDPHLQPAPEP